MVKNKAKEHFMAVPVEKHDTAAWAQVKETKPVSNVTVPSEQSTRNAKDYVDANQK